MASISCTYIFVILFLKFFYHGPVEGVVSMYQKHLSPCHIFEEEELLCDHKEFLCCSNGTCICYSDFSYNFKSGKCEPHSRVKRLIGGKKLPGEYCSLSVDCVEGLVCNSTTCQCPSMCKYVGDKGACDCGKVELKFPLLMISVTVLLSVVSLLIWAYLIRKTYKSAENKTEQNNVNNGENEILNMVPLNDPETWGSKNLKLPNESTPQYSASTREWKEHDPVYPLYGASGADTTAWKVSPMLAQENANTSLPSDYHKDSYPVGLTHKYNFQSDGVSTSSFLSSENVLHVEPVKNNASLGFNVTSHESPGFANPVTSDGSSLPYPILPQTMSSSSEVKSSEFLPPQIRSSLPDPPNTTGN